MLNILLSEKVEASEKIRVLENDFQIPATKKIVEEVEEMCSLGQGIENIGIAKGIALGIEQGIEQGRKEGRKETKLESAKRLLEMGFAIEDIAKGVGLELDFVRQLI